MILFNPTGSLNVAVEPSDLPQETGDNLIVSGAMVRGKNLRTNEIGKAKTRDGSAKINGSAIDTSMWLIVEQNGTRYSFAGAKIYANEVSIKDGLTSASWSAIKYNAFNDDSQHVFALNGTDRKRIRATSVYEWGIDAPNFAPSLAAGLGTGLTGLYNVRYTYLRKVGSVVVAESNPSPEPSEATLLTDQSLSIEITEPEDAQVTHVRIYRTFAGGEIYHFDSEIEVGGYDFSYAYSWESSDYLSGTGYKFTSTSTATSGSVGVGSVLLTSQDALSYTFDTTTAGYQLGNNGVASILQDSITVPIADEWLTGGSAGEYEARATLISGDIPSGSLSTWVSLSTTRNWTLTSLSGSKFCSLTIEIRELATTNVVATANVTILAEVA